MENKSKKSKIIYEIAPLISIAVLFFIWFILAKSIDNEFILPSISETLKSLWNLLKQGEFYASLFNTLLRSLIAFLSSFIIAFVVAVLSNGREVLKKTISPIISIIRALPTIAVVLLLLFWTNSYVAPIIVTMLVVLPTLYTNMENALSSVDKDALVMCKAFNVSKKDVLKKVYIPQITPAVLRCVGSGFSLNIKLMVAAEVLSQTAKSLGYMLNTSKVYFEISQMIGIVIITVIIGILVEFLFNKLSEAFSKWM